MSVRARDEVALCIGGVHVSGDGVVLKTLLGSCVSVCLFDPVTRVGGMNHFALPRASTASVRRRVSVRPRWSS